jgi:hypothetical protein
VVFVHVSGLIPRLWIKPLARSWLHLPRLPWSTAHLDRWSMARKGREVKVSSAGVVLLPLPVRRRGGGDSGRMNAARTSALARTFPDVSWQPFVPTRGQHPLHNADQQRHHGDGRRGGQHHDGSRSSLSGQVEEQSVGDQEDVASPPSGRMHPVLPISGRLS